MRARRQPRRTTPRRSAGPEPAERRRVIPGSRRVMTGENESASLSNQVIAERLDAFASLLELAGSGFYTSRAYRRAAETIRDTLAPAEELIRAERIRELRGIGPGIAVNVGRARGDGHDRRVGRARTRRPSRPDRPGTVSGSRAEADA